MSLMCRVNFFYVVLLNFRRTKEMEFMEIKLVLVLQLVFSITLFAQIGPDDKIFFQDAVEIEPKFSAGDSIYGSLSKFEDLISSLEFNLSTDFIKMLNKLACYSRRCH